MTKWTSFWDSFKSAIHENEGLSRVDKFNHLNSLVEGSSKRSIEGLSFSDSNYDSAVEFPNERFKNPQQIISGHMDELLKLPNCTETDRPTKLRFIYDKLNVHVRGLCSLAEQYGRLLVPVIMSKLPQNLRLRKREIKS